MIDRSLLLISQERDGMGQVCAWLSVCECVARRQSPWRQRD